MAFHGMAGGVNLISPEAARMALAEASHPGNSAFVSAHAGAGKTKLLIDRLLRLMLDGADPARILCLTYTRAAAAEMAVRLQTRLGEMVSLDDAALDDRLKALHLAPTPTHRERARGLFATVLDLPGGMRIQTIHAFCQTLLRRFPLEAQVSPHFSVLQELESRTALAEAREAGLPEAGAAAMALLAGLVAADGFAQLFCELNVGRERFAAALALPASERARALRRAAGCAEPDIDAAWDMALALPDEARLRDGLRRIAAEGAAGAAERARRLLAWLGAPPEGRRGAWAAWEREWFTGTGAPCSASRMCNEALAKRAPELAAVCVDEQQRLVALQAEFRAHRAAAATAALLEVAAPMLRAYDSAKGGQWLDYDDLIARSARLLVHPGAEWVLYKLDGGLDHLLLDEVQDTAPAQWHIAASLTAEFFAGAGARLGTPRTIFAVGDRKQSIFSFQGADPAGFAAWRGRFGSQARQANAGWQEPVLDECHRSTAAVLRLVDAVFAAPEAARGVCEGEVLRHHCRRVGQAGSVELWPLAPRPPAETLDPWRPPERNRRRETAQATLITGIANWIQLELASGRRLESAGRKLETGDFLVLVRSRTHVPAALVAALKARKIAVAGLDRMQLAAQPAVQDLLSLCQALLLPQDELSLAEYLTSPLGGLDDASLMALAVGRSGELWAALRGRAAERPEWQRAAAEFQALLSRVDFASPYALLCEALGPAGGRARLLARLGPEAAEPIDELLQAALDYEARHPASLQGFLHWLERSGTEIKREAEAAGGAVRVMTVHGAKGLEAPVVILADTVSAERDKTGLHAVADPESGCVLPLWALSGDHAAPGIERARQAAASRCTEEYNRLLYVALTRARDRLVICGWEPHRGAPAECWYSLVRAGMEREGAERFEHAWGQGLRLSCAQTAPPEIQPARESGGGSVAPAWMGAAPLWRAAAPPAEPARRQPLAPSRPEGVERGPAPPARSPLAAGAGTDRFARGRTIHALLQHLPELPEAAREAAAVRFAGAALAREVLAVLAEPGLAPLFGPGSRAEQPLCGTLGAHVITGRIDRLAVLADCVLIADYKTGVAAPRTAEAAPVAYLRQMAAYRALLRAIYPDREVRSFLVFTEGPAVLELPGALLDGHSPGAEA